MPFSSVSLRSRRTKLLALAAMAVFALAAAAHAAHWPFYGGDQGRSGYQPLNNGSPPAFRVHAQTGAVEDNVQNSIVTGAAGAFYAFGVEDANQQGEVHVHDLVGGDLWGGIQVDDGANDSDTFRGLNVAGNENDYNRAGTNRRLEGQGVAFADLTIPGGAEQFLVVHNDDNQDGTNDVSVALIDVANGFKRRDQAVLNSDKFTIASSPVLGPTNTSTTPPERYLYFVAFRQETTPDDDMCVPPPLPVPPGQEACVSAETRLYRVTISNPNTTSAQVTAAQNRAIPNGNPIASPSLANLDVSGGPKLHVIVGASGGVVSSFDANDLNQAGPTITLPNDGDVQTVAVPVNADGTAPAQATAMFAAVGQSATNPTRHNFSTRVYRLNGNLTAFSASPGPGQSASLAGTPAAALATDFHSDEPDAAGHVVVTTSNNLYTLNANDLRAGTRMSFADDRTAGGNGFSRNSGAINSGLVFISQDDGMPRIADIETSQLLPEFLFERYESHGNATGSYSLGQPSIFNRFIQYGHSSGAYVYRLEPEPEQGRPKPTDVAVGIAVSDASITEGNAGTRQLTFTVSLTGQLGTRVVADYITADGTATAPSDYGATAGRLTFAPGETSKTVTVNVNGDTVDENVEQFSLNLRNVIGAATADGQGVGTIADDDDTPVAGVSIVAGDTAVPEGDTGRRNAVFTIALSRAATTPVAVGFSTVDATARAGQDYVASRGTVTFAAGELSKTVSVPIIGDETFEADERFGLNLSGATGAIIGRAAGIGTIVNDDIRRRAARSLRVSVRPSRDRSFPYRFRVIGQLVLPSGVTRTQGCGSGLVSAQYKAGTKTISTRRVTLGRDCRFSIRTTFSIRSRLPRSGRLKLTVRFAGNRYLLRRNARPMTVRVG